MSSAVQRSATRYLFVGVLVLGAMYAWWTLTQYERLNARNQRELADAGLELERTINNALQNVRLLGSVKESLAACAFDREQPYLEFIGTCDDTMGVRLEEVKAEPHAGGLRIRGGPKGLADGAGVAFRFRADTLLDELAFSDTFGLVVVTDDKGKALDHRVAGDRGWTRLLSWPERAWEANGSGPGSAIDVHDVAALIGGAPPMWTQVAAASTRTTVDLGGEWQHLYSHPFVIDEVHGGTQLVLVGLVPVRGVVRQALAVDTHFVAVLAILLLLGTLGFPFIKLAALNNRERFRLWDVHLLYASTGALLVLLVFAVLTLDGYVRFQAVADRGLETMAGDVATNVLQEMEAIRDQLAAYDATVAAGTRVARPCEDTEVAGGWFASPSPVLPLAFTPGHLYLEQAAWIGPAGRQVWKITSDPSGELVDVSKRPYVRAVRDGRLFKAHGREPAFFVAPDRSISDGRFYTFLSIRSQLSEQKACGSRSDGGPYVAVATARLQSVDRQPLPAGYGFAIIDREGRVLYHSDARLSLRQNLFRELSAGRDIRAMVYSDQPHRASSRYQERPTRLFLRPLQLAPDTQPGRSAGLYVVAFRDVSLERAVAARAFVTSLAGPLPLLVVVLCAAIQLGSWASRRSHGSPGRWLWPHGGLTPMYKRLTAAFLLAMLVGFVGLALERWTWVIIGLPVLAAGGGIAVYWRSDRDTTRVRLDRQGWLLAEFTLLATCMVILPSAAVFSVTLGHEFGTLVATEQDWIARQRASVAQAITAEARADQHPDAVGRLASRSWQTHAARTPAPFKEPMRSSDIHHGPAASVVDVHTWIDRALPIESDIASRQRYRLDDGASYDLGGWPGLRLGWVAVVGLAAALGALLWWFRWNASRLFLVDVEVPCPPPVEPTGDLAAAWASCSEAEQDLLMQVAEERIANPYQRELTLGLLKRHLLTLCPELQPAPPAWEAFILAKARENPLAERLRASEEAGETHSWRYVRTVLLTALVAVSAFLLATQPGLQSDLIGIGTGVSALATAALKVRESAAAWLAQRRTA